MTMTDPNGGGPAAPESPLAETPRITGYGFPPGTPAPAVEYAGEDPGTAGVRVAHKVAADALEAAEPEPADALRAEVRAETAPGGDGGTAPGWYPHPGHEGMQGHWDGEGWTGELLPVGQATPEQVDAEAIPPGSFRIPLATTEVYVLPRNRWRSSALTALNQGRFDEWAESCLAREIDVDAWMDVDPTIEQVEDFFLAFTEATGQSAGKSRESRRSLMRGRRR